MAAQYSSLNHDGENKTWNITAVEGKTGLFYFQNVGRKNYIEWYSQYSNWSSYNPSTRDDQYELAIYTVPAGVGGSGTVTPPAHTHTPCEICDKCTAEDCTGEKCEGHQTAPVAGITEGQYTISAVNGKGTLYFSGTISDGRFNGVYEAAKATVVTVTAVEGGYIISFTVEGATKYIVMGDSTTKGALVDTAAEATIFEWNETVGTLVVAEDSNNRTFAVGATSTYDTFSAYDISGSYNWCKFNAVN
jgi:hypothetical protein